MLALKEASVDLTAVIHRRAEIGFAKIGARTRVWQFASVIRGAVLGEDCNVAANAIVDGAIIGDRCLIGHASAINPGVVIDDDVFIAPGVSCCNDAWPRASKAGFEIEQLVSGEFVTIRIAAGASIGAGVIIMPGTMIGKGAMVAGGVTVERNIPSHHILYRDGSLREINRLQNPRRMREAVW